MNNEEKILSMLDAIARQVTKLTETSATKDELRSFREQTNNRFNQMDERFDKMDERFDEMEEKMVTKAEFIALVDENSTAHEAILANADQQSELLEAGFDVLNDRLFTQETQLMLLKKKEAL